MESKIIEINSLKQRNPKRRRNCFEILVVGQGGMW